MEKELKQFEPPKPQKLNIDGVLQHFRGLYGLFEVVSSAPAIVSKRFYNQLKIFKSSNDKRFYWYDHINNAWSFVKEMVTAVENNGDSGSAKTIDWTKNNYHKITLTDDCTFTFTDPLPGLYVLEVIQDGTGSRLATWDGDVKWASGTAPTLSSGAGDIDVFQFYYNGSSYYGMTMGLNYS